MPPWWALAAGLYWPKWLNKPNCYDPSRQAVHLKVRRRGASDAEMLWSLIASLAAGHGALSDLDALRVNPAGQVLLGLSEAPSGRRLGEYLSRFWHRMR